MVASWNPIVQALMGTLFTWGMTGIGASAVFCTKKMNQKIMDLFYGFAGGIMISASFFSLLEPSIEISQSQEWSRNIAWIPTSIGFLVGVAFVKMVEFLIMKQTQEELPPPPKDANNPRELSKHDSSSSDSECETFPKDDVEAQSDEDKIFQMETNRIKKIGASSSRLFWGPQSTRGPSWNRVILLILCITLHNIPEGLAVGVAFGSVQTYGEDGAWRRGVALALGVGIQNFPEGLGVSMPLRREGMSPLRSFFHGQLSGAVEPLGGVLGALLVLEIEPLLPFALAFAAGAVLYVTIAELIPESQRSGHKSIATTGTVFGFTLMMILDLALS